MPIICEFEEDAFQQAVDIAISKNTNIFTTPGRVSESVLGYDAAFFINPSSHFRMLRNIAYRRSARYLRLHGINISEEFFADFDKLTKSPPKFKFNLFIQYKVPDKLVGNRSAQWKHWKSDYYRFSIRQKQLKILCDLEARAAGRAIVCYASPTFIEIETLEKLSAEDKILESANFVSAGYLDGHHFYTYQTALGIGRAHSEVAEVTPMNLKSEIIERTSKGAGKSLIEAVDEVCRIILRTDWGKKTLGETKPQENPQGFLNNIGIIRRFEMHSGTKLHLLG